MILSEHSFYIVDNFSVKDFNNFSDHAPLSFNVKCNVRVLVEEPYVCEHVKWRDDEKQHFRDGLISRATDFNDFIHSYVEQSDANIDDLVKQFTNIVRDIADPLFIKRVNKYPQFERHTISDSDKWFDQECSEAKRLYKDALHIYNNSHSQGSTNPLARSKFRVEIGSGRVNISAALVLQGEWHFWPKRLKF